MGRSHKDQVDLNADRAAEQWPAIDPLVEAIVNRIAKTARYLDRLVGETASRHGLNASDYRLLVALWKGGPQSPGELGKRLLVSSGVMTNRLDRLEGKGLVAREPHPHDRRAVVITLTEAGSATLSEMISEQAAKERRLLSPLEVSQRGDLNELMKSLMEAFDPSIRVEEGGLSS
jgi:DNA-binding MarR family transcriptional regulator